jgi:hypothetical protein
MIELVEGACFFALILFVPAVIESALLALRALRGPPVVERNTTIHAQ